MKKLLGERDTKSQERGLRQRIKNTENNGDNEDDPQKDRVMLDAVDGVSEPVNDQQVSNLALHNQQLNQEMTPECLHADVHQDGQMQADQVSGKGGEQDLKISLDNDEELL